MGKETERGIMDRVKLRKLISDSPPPPPQGETKRGVLIVQQVMGDLDCRDRSSPNAEDVIDVSAP